MYCFVWSLSQGIRDQYRAPPKSPPEKQLAEMKFGDRLRQAREARGVTLDAIYQETHIAKRYLEALENSDVGALPGGIFDKGFIRSYAQYVGIDPEPILTAYRVARRQASPEHEADPERVLHELALEADRRGATRAWPRVPASVAVGLALIGIALLVASVWLILADGSSEDEIERHAIAQPRPDDEPGSATELLSPVVEMPIAEPATPETAEREPEPSAEIDEVQAGRVTVSEAGLGTSVVKHALNGRADRFAEGTRVFFWNRVLNGEKGMVLRHVWKLGDEVVRLSELTLGGPHWRTYSSYTLPPGSTGTWTVEAIGPDGRVLFHKEFVCFDAPDLDTGVWELRLTRTRTSS
jgi:transcriptional regulator with XRE-family HTH domain